MENRLATETYWL